MSEEAPPTEVIDMLERTWRSISALLSEASESEWLTPTDCPGWTVQDQLAHLVGMERLLQGLPTALAGREAGLAREDIAAFNEAEIPPRRAMTGAAVLAEWNDVVEQRLATLRSADAAFFSRPAMTPVGPGTVRSYLDVRVLDCWVHEQDIRRALGRPGHTDGPAAEHTIDRLLRLVPIVVGRRAGTPEGATVVLELSGPVHRRVASTVRDGRARIDDELPDEPLATLRMDSDAFVVLANGRGPFERVSDRVQLAGDLALARAVASNLNVMI